MRSRRSFLSVQISGLLLAGSVALAAGPARRGPVGMPSDYVPRLDGAMATADLGGQTWGVWAYRAAGEFDIAVSTRGPSGVWSAPIFLGQRDGRLHRLWIRDREFLCHVLRHRRQCRVGRRPLRGP